MKLKWIRGNEHISFKRPNVWFGLGVRGSGKSSFLESVGEEYLNRGATIFDLFSARDGESLAWLRSPYAKDKKILLVHGENVSVSSSVDSKNAGSLTLNDVENYDIIISSSPLYSSPDQEFLNAVKITDLLYKRLHWKRVVYLIMREASNFYYSRLKITESQTIAKANMVYLIRESRHCGLSLALDSVRFFSIDIDIRTLADYLILKSQGMQGLSRDLKWLYSYVEPHLVRQLKPNQFILLTKKGGISYGVFPEVSWHKKEQEDILKVLGIKREFTEPIQEGTFKGTFKTVGDQEHVKIIDFYFQGKSMGLISQTLKRSSATIHKHVKQHNEAIERLGYCMRCRRLKGSHEAEKAERLISTTT